MILISLMYVKNSLTLIFSASALLALLMLGACEGTLLEPHKIDIEQGNAITQEEFESLYTGMSEADVLQAVGAPLLTDPFHPERWEYLYRLKPGKGRERNSRFTLYFRDGILVKIDGKDYKEY